MAEKATNLPDEDHVMRSVPWTRLRKDENDNVMGTLPQAFQLRPGEQSLSVNWVEFFDDPATRLRDCVWAIREARKVGAKSAFAVGNVGKIKHVCLGHGHNVRIVHEPKDDEPSHSGIRRLPPDDLILLAALADDAFTSLIMNADITAKPAGDPT